MFGATVVTVYILKVYLDDVFVYNFHHELQNIDPYILVFMTWQRNVRCMSLNIWVE